MGGVLLTSNFLSEVIIDHLIPQAAGMEVGGLEEG